jgi:hypothetical protein
MRHPVHFRWPPFLAALAVLAFVPSGEGADDATWPMVNREQKPWTRWWWPGSAVDKENLARQLSAFAAIGLGGVEITPIYGAKGYESRFIKFLSPDYVSMLGYTASEARRLDLGVDMATCTGWPFGGPWVAPADAEQEIAITDGRLTPRPTGFRVKRSAPGDEGLVVNPFSPAAVARYLEPFTAALSALPWGTLHAQFHDSYEYSASWASEVPDRFLAMHGYDLRDHLAELGGRGDPDTIARLKADYRETLAVLHLEYIRTWVNWSHRIGSLAREQAHGAPGNLLDLYAAADVPETEIFGSTPFPIPLYRHLPSETGADVPPPLVNRMASSAAHVGNHALASSETFTWMREHFHEALSEAKPELDQLFLTGINRIYYHGNAYSPADAPWPGWVFYASTQENSRNSLWDEFAWLNAYIARCQTLLQAGAPDNDLLVYWPVYDLWHDADGWVKQFGVDNARTWMNETPCGILAHDLVVHGYTFDYISDAQLEQTRAEGERLKTPGAAYRAVLVPKTGHLPPATLHRLLALAADGATVVFVGALPTDVPGYGQLTARRAQFKAELARLDFKSTQRPGLSAAGVGRGRILLGDSFASAIAGVDAAREPAADSGLGVLRRRTSEGEIYFIANLSAEPFEGWIRLGRSTAAGAVLMDARSGRTGVAARRGPANGAEVYLQLQPGESMFVKTLASRPAKGPAWQYFQEAGAPATVSGRWAVAFSSGGPKLPPAFSTEHLGSWTDQGGESERFAGTARYETEVNLPGGAQADDWRLDLGDVRETARVFVNGTEVDRLWSLPFSTRVGAQLRPGRNVITLEVTNLAANRIRDLDIRGEPWKNFYEINFVNINYRNFDASKWPLQPSGLLGPVQLVPLRSLNP